MMYRSASLLLQGIDLPKYAIYPPKLRAAVERNRTGGDSPKITSDVVYARRLGASDRKAGLMEKPGHWAELPHALQDRDLIA